ncbi:MAG TPA: acyl-CoA dehydrogenase, partial [Rhodocyclaceae bacterium]|nr:acyl-CoA dehydrogenase [Rhodocyclaceae bacterium]
EVASDGVQVHGGMGYIEETGAAQHFRDARITAIYEGTTAIQANDLVGRKVGRDQGAVAREVIAHMRAVLASLKDDAELRPIAAQLAPAIDALEKSVQWIVANYASDLRSVLASAVPFLKLFGIVTGGWQMARAAWLAKQHLAAGENDPFWAAKLTTSRFYADHFLTQAPGLALAVTGGASAVLEMADDSF